MIVYSVLAEVSIGRMFIASIIPGILIVFGLTAMIVTTPSPRRPSANA